MKGYKPITKIDQTVGDEIVIDDFCLVVEAINERAVTLRIFQSAEQIGSDNEIIEALEESSFH